MVTGFVTFCANRGHKIPDELIEEYFTDPKVGDSVMVLADSYAHEFNEGQVVKITEIEDDSYKCESDEDYWWLCRSEFEKI